MRNASNAGAWAPGQVWAEGPEIVTLTGRATAKLTVRNTGDRPIQVGSHFHFFEVNRALAFFRPAAWGMRLAIASGTAVRFEPGLEYEVELIALGGERVVHGFNALAEGALDDPAIRASGLQRAQQRGFNGDES